MLIQCSSAQEAVTVYEHLDEGIDLILSDILMPGMNGKIMVELIKSKIGPVSMTTQEGDKIPCRGY